MPTLELELGDERLNNHATQAYYERQQGDSQQWQAKLAGLKAIKLETIQDPLEVVRIKNDMVICEREILRIATELDLVHKQTINPKTKAPYTVAEARLFLKHGPSTKLNRHKQVG